MLLDLSQIGVRPDFVDIRRVTDLFSDWRGLLILRLSQIGVRPDFVDIRSDPICPKNITWTPGG